MPTFTSQKPAGIAESFASMMQGNKGLTQSDVLNAEKAISGVESSRATAQHQTALAEKVRLELEQMRDASNMRKDPALAAEFGARNAGIALPDAQRIEQNFRGESLPPVTPNDDEGNAMPAAPIQVPTNVNPQQLGLYNAARAGLMANNLATGKTNAAELTKSVGEGQQNSIVGAVQAAIAKGDMQGASAMNQGAKPGTAIKLFDDVGNTGATYSPATGAVNAKPGSNALLDGTLGNVKAQTGAHNAQANNANASAGQHRASTEKIRADQSREEKGQYDSARGILVDPRTGVAREVMDAEGNPIGSKPTPTKALPSAIGNKIFENQQNLRRAEQALALIEGKSVTDEDGKVIAKGDKNATGAKGFLPDQLLQRLDTEGNPTRAAIADLGSLIIHDRSGAAVTASEFPRLAPFIPTAKDDPAVVKQKLTRFVTEYRKVVGEMSDFYRESGYNVPSEKLRDAGVQKPAAADASNPAAEIQDTKVVKGVTYVKVGGKWFKQ